MASSAGHRLVQPAPVEERPDGAEELGVRHEEVVVHGTEVERAVPVLDVAVERHVGDVREPHLVLHPDPKETGARCRA